MLKIHENILYLKKCLGTEWVWAGRGDLEAPGTPESATVINHGQLHLRSE